MVEKAAPTRAGGSLLHHLFWLCVVGPLFTAFWYIHVCCGGPRPAPPFRRHSAAVLPDAPISPLISSGKDNTQRSPKAPPAVAASESRLDISWGNVNYILKLWDIFLQKQFSDYQPSQHGILQPKYAGYKAKFFYEEMLSATERDLEVKTICEVGMYAGVSAQFWLLLHGDAKLYTFDTFAKGKGLSQFAADALVHMGRTQVVKGSSLDTVPKFIKEHPEEKCDLVFIDGNKKYEYRLQDLKNLHAASHAGTLVLLDEVCSVICVSGGPKETCEGKGGTATACLAYRTAVQQGIIDLARCLDESNLPPLYPPNDFVCSARFRY